MVFQISEFIMKVSVKKPAMIYKFGIAPLMYLILAIPIGPHQVVSCSDNIT